MKRVIIDSLTIHDVSLPQAEKVLVKYFVNLPIKGLAAVQHGMASFERSGEDGIYIGSNFMRERRISISGGLIEQVDNDSYQTLRKALIALQLPPKDSLGVISPRIFRFLDDNSQEYKIQGYINKIDFPDQWIGSARFLIDIICERWYFESVTTKSVELTTGAGGGFVLPVTLPIFFDPITGNQANIDNEGDAPAWPTITLVGPLTNPRISNNTVGLSFELTETIAVGETVVVDMFNKTVLKDGSSIMSTVKSTSDWWWLDPGVNDVETNSTGGVGDTGTVTVEHNDAYSGI